MKTLISASPTSRLVRSLVLLMFPAAAGFCTESLLTISPEVSHELRPELFGQFLERPSWGGETGPESLCDVAGNLPPEIVKHLGGMRARVVRFPHGTDNDYTSWTDLIDLPGRAQRPVTMGHQGDPVTNRFGYVEYFRLAKQLGWRTILVTNLRDALYRKAPLPEAAAKAAELVRFATEHGVDLAAVQVGNEGWFFWPPKPEEREALGVADLRTAAAWLQECLLAYADAIRAVRADLPLICDAPRESDGGGLENDAGVVWREAVDAGAMRSRYTMLAAHAYAPMRVGRPRSEGTFVPPGELSEDEVWLALTTTLGRYDGSGQAVADAAAYDSIAELGYRAAVTEWNWNGWDVEERFPNLSFKEGVPAALGAAGFLQGMMRHPNVAMATQSMLLGRVWGITAVRVMPDGAVGYIPQAEAVRLYAQFHGKKVHLSALDPEIPLPRPHQLVSWWPQAVKVSALDALVTADDAHWYVHLIHRQRGADISLRVVLPEPLSGNRMAELHTLRGAEEATPFGIDGMKREVSQIRPAGNEVKISLPAASVSVLVIPRGAPFTLSQET